MDQVALKYYSGKENKKIFGHFPVTLKLKTIGQPYKNYQGRNL
jgi:hypothetical protein